MNFFILAGVLAVQMSTPQPVAAGEINCNTNLPPEKNAICLKQTVERRAKTMPELQQFAIRLIKKGDRAFRKRNFGQAYKAYDLSRVNAPTAYASLRAGDALFAGIATATVFHDAEGKSVGQCYSTKDYLFTVDNDIPNLYETGIELHKILAAGPPVSDAMIGDTARKVACLRELAAKYRQVQPGCVDLAALRACALPAQARKAGQQ